MAGHKAWAGSDDSVTLSWISGLTAYRDAGPPSAIRTSGWKLVLQLRPKHHENIPTDRPFGRSRLCVVHAVRQDSESPTDLRSRNVFFASSESTNV